MSSDLSPPVNTTKALDDLTDSTGALIDAFDEIIKLPFVDALRIDELGDKSIAEVVLDLKQKYQTLQGNTLPFARDLYGYAGVQAQTIPLINDSLSLQTYLNLNKVIIARHKLEATQVKKESEAFRKTFAATLDVFENTIKELAEQIQELNQQIQVAEDLQEKERAVSIIAGVLTFVFTVAAVLAVIATAGAVGAAGGGVAGGSVAGGSVAGGSVAGGSAAGSAAAGSAAAGSAAAGSAAAGSAAAGSVAGGSVAGGSAAGSVAGGSVAAGGGISGFVTGLAAGIGGIGAKASALGASIGVAGTSGLVGTSVGFGSAATASLAETIVSSIEARNFARAVSGLQSLKDSAEATRKQLVEVIGLMEGVETSLDEIVTVWTDVEASLELIQSDVDNWNEENFSQDLAATTVDEWNDVRAAVDKYTAVVSGARSLNSVEDVDESERKLTGERVMIIAKSLAAAELKQSLQAPDIEFNGKLSDLKQSRTGLHLAKSFPDVGDTLKSQVETAEKLLTETEQGMASSMSPLAVLARERQTWLEMFETPGDRSKMITDLVRKTERIEDGIALAQENEANAFSFQASVGLVNNTLIRLIAEKNATQQALTKQLKALDEDRRRRKWTWLIPIAGAINEIVDAANNIRGKIKRLRRDIAQLSTYRVQLRTISRVVSSSVQDSTVISQTYSQILNDTRACADDAVLFESIGEEIPPEVLISVKQSWVDLETDINDFMS